MECSIWKKRQTVYPKIPFPAGRRIHLAEGLDGCLFLYPKAIWEQLINKLSQLPLTRADARSFIRSLGYNATEVDIDSLGCVLVPDYLRALPALWEPALVAER